MAYDPNNPDGLPPAGQVPPAQYPPPAAAGGGLSEYAAAAISYITIIPAIIFLLVAPYNRSAFVRFHAFQCIAFSVVVFVIHMVLAFIPIIGWILSLLLTLVFFVLWVICIMKALKGEWYKLPVIGDFALKQAQS